MARLIKMEVKGLNPAATDVERYEHQVAHQTDANRPGYSGMRVHEPVKITKLIDKQSPQLFKLLVENQMADEVKFTFFRSETASAGKPYYTVVLKKAHVQSITQSSELGPREPYETVEFKFEQITQTVLDGGIEHTDEWKPPSHS
jgi:type VI secretion system secreted protein Hcp